MKAEISGSGAPRRFPLRSVALAGTLALVGGVMAGCEPDKIAACKQYHQVEAGAQDSLWQFAVDAGNGNLSSPEISALEDLIRKQNAGLFTQSGDVQGNVEYSVPVAGSCNFENK